MRRTDSKRTASPNYFDPARAVPSLEALADYRDVTEREYEQPAAFEEERAVLRLLE